MTPFRSSLLLAAAASTLIAGCKKTADTTPNYAAAIDQYYASRPACLWADEIKFPVQADTSDATKTASYDALVDQGLLTRTSGEKKVFIVASKQVNFYDLSDKGRAAWTADAQQPGYGNFCYGHRKVAAIDSAAPTGDQPGATAAVSFHYTFADAPAWANSPEMENAFPQLRTDLSAPHTGSATLTDTPGGWTVSSAPRTAGLTPNGKSITPADGSIVR
jgi:hypothetical protein